MVMIDAFVQLDYRHVCFSILPQAVSNHAFGVSMHLICPTGDCSVLRNAETLEVMISGPYPKDVEKRFGKLGCKAHFPISSHLSRPHGKGFCHRLREQHSP